MNRYHIFSSLRVRLVLLALLAVLPALGIVLYDAVKLREREVAQAKAEALTLSHLAASQHQEVIEATRQVLLTVAQFPEVQADDPEVCRSRLTALLEDYEAYKSFTVADHDGDLVCSTIPLSEPVSVANRSWFRQAMQSRDFAVGDYQLGRLDGSPIIVFAYPVIDPAGIIRGVVAASLQVEQFNQIAAEADLPEQATLTIVDRNGTVIARTPQAENWVGQTLPYEPLIMAIRAAGEGKTEVADLDGVRRLYAFTPLHQSIDTGLYLAIGIPKALAFAEADRIWRRNLLVLGLVGLLALAAAWVGSDLFVLRSVNRLIAATRRLQRDLSARTGMSHQAGELGLLARAFDDLAAALEEREAERQQARQELIALNTSLETRVAERTAQMQAANRWLQNEIAERKEAQDALQQSTAKFEGLFESAPDAIILTDYQGRIVELNRQAEVLFGYERADLLYEPVEILLPARFRNRHRAHRADYHANPRPRQMGIDLELHGRRGDGSEVPLDITLSPLTLQDEILTISIIRDISEHKQLEAELTAVQRQLLESSELERLRIAQELHDGPIQELISLSFQLDELEKMLPDETGQGQLVAAAVLTQQVTQNLRALCTELRPPTLAAFGLERAIRSHANQFQEQHPELTIQLDLAQDGQQLSERVRLALYRVYQEALNNIIRHTQAHQVQVRLGLDQEQIRLDIRDDGCGFRLPRRWVLLAQAGHLGLVGMRERIQSIDGQLQITSAPGQGTSVQVIVPQQQSFPNDQDAQGKGRY